MLKLRVILSAGMLLICGIMVILFFYADRTGAVSAWLRQWGIRGILLSVGLMAFFAVIPVPSEFLLILNMRIYGIGLGILYAWIGLAAGTVITYFIARNLGAPLVRRWISEENLRKVEAWVERRGAVGLLFARLLPLPAPVVNYAAGSMAAVSFQSYLWTAIVSIGPYYIGAACFYEGIPGRFTLFSPWLLIGAACFLLLWLTGFALNRRSKVNRESKPF